MFDSDGNSNSDRHQDQGGLDHRHNFLTDREPDGSDKYVLATTHRSFHGHCPIIRKDRLVKLRTHSHQTRTPPESHVPRPHRHRLTGRLNQKASREN